MRLMDNPLDTGPSVQQEAMVDIGLLVLSRDKLMRLDHTKVHCNVCEGYNRHSLAGYDASDTLLFSFERKSTSLAPPDCFKETAEGIVKARNTMINQDALVVVEPLHNVGLAVVSDSQLRRTARIEVTDRVDVIDSHNWIVHTAHAKDKNENTLFTMVARSHTISFPDSLRSAMDAVVNARDALPTPNPIYQFGNQYVSQQALSGIVRVRLDRADSLDQDILATFDVKRNPFINFIYEGSKRLKQYDAEIKRLFRAASHSVSTTFRIDVPPDRTAHRQAQRARRFLILLQSATAGSPMHCVDDGRKLVVHIEALAAISAIVGHNCSYGGVRDFLYSMGFVDRGWVDRVCPLRRTFYHWDPEFHMGRKDILLLLCPPPYHLESATLIKRRRTVLSELCNRRGRVEEPLDPPVPEAWGRYTEHTPQCVCVDHTLSFDDCKLFVRHATVKHMYWANRSVISSFTAAVSLEQSRWRHLMSHEVLPQLLQKVPVRFVWIITLPEDWGLYTTATRSCVARSQYRYGKLMRNERYIPLIGPEPVSQHF